MFSIKGEFTGSNLEEFKKKDEENEQNKEETKK